MSVCFLLTRQIGSRDYPVNDSSVSSVFVKSPMLSTSEMLNVASTWKLAPTSPTTSISGIAILPRVRLFHAIASPDGKEIVASTSATF